jgi:dynactin complex subunit
MSTFTTNNTSSRIARPSSIGLINTPLSTQIITNRRRISNVNEDDNKVSLMKKKQKQIKAPNSHLSKSHSMQRLDQYLLGVDEQEEQVTKQMNRRALLSRATTTPMPRPSSLIKRFSEHTTGVLITTKQASSNVMKRSQSLANPVRNEEEIMGGGLVAAANFIFGQRVSIPSLGVAGTVRFFGETQFKRDAGHWVGIELDVKGAGKNDGSIQGYSIYKTNPSVCIRTKSLSLFFQF